MKFTEAKEKIEALLAAAGERITAAGVKVTPETELIENQISETEAEPLMLLGSLALYTDGMGEDDVYYISVEAKIEGGEVSDEALEAAMPKFDARVAEAAERLSAAEDKTETLLAMGREVDAELERLYEEEARRNEAAMKRDLKIAIIGSAAIIVLVVLAVIISKLF